MFLEIFDKKYLIQLKDVTLCSDILEFVNTYYL